MSDFLQPGQHPDADQLNAFAEQALPPHEREATLVHLATCAHCRAIVALALPAAEEMLPQPTAPRRRWSFGWRVLFVSAPTLSALVMLFFLVGVHTPKAPDNVAVVRPEPSPQPVTEAPAERALIHAKPAPTAKIQPAPATPAPLKPPAPSVVLDAQSIQNLPMDNRNAAELPAATPASADSAAAGVAAAPMALRKSARDVSPGPLPSGLPIASTAVSGSRMLALDTRHDLFRSEDGGRHWVPVAATWMGRAVSVSLSTDRPRSYAAAAPKAQARFRAQAGSLILTGTVTDVTGAAIPNATVSTTSEAVKTDAFGRYTISGLAAQTYTLEATSPGFERKTQTVSVAAPGPTVVNLQLAVGSVSETVSVSAANSVIDTISTPSVAPAQFEIVTERGERWTSFDGKNWTR